MPELDPFRGAIAGEAELREHYEQPQERVLRKEMQHLDEMSRRLIAGTPMVLLSTHSAEGRCDVSPRGGQPGFVHVLDDRHVLIPDATGNKRLDSLRNIVETGQAGLLFLIGGREMTLRVNGRACVSADPELLDLAGAVGKPPRSAIVVRADEVYTHCPKAFVRSRMWDPESWPAPGELPSPAEVALAHLRDPELTLEQVAEQQAESLRTRLA